MRGSLICLICSLWTIAATAKNTQLCGNFRQGELILGKTTEGIEEITVNKTTFPVLSDGRFLLVFSREEKPKTEIRLKENTIYQIEIARVKWDIQNIQGVAQHKVTPSKQHESEILREKQDVQRALTTVDFNRQDWEKGFILPVEGRISGKFGNQRIFNGVPKSPHSGVDIAAPLGTPVRAASDGKVLLSGGNYFYGGNMVILDHGSGLHTIYMHLKEAKAAVGQEVKKGEIIGSVGSTGRATGPHLHWGASLQNIRFQPHSLLDLTDKKCIFLEKGNPS